MTTPCLIVLKTQFPALEIFLLRRCTSGTSLVVKNPSSNAGKMSSIPSQRTKVPLLWGKPTHLNY